LDVAKKSGARIIPLSGFDSTPSDLLSIFATVEALCETRDEQVEIEKGTALHSPSQSGGLNAGTVHTTASLLMDIKKKLLVNMALCIRLHAWLMILFV